MRDKLVAVRIIPWEETSDQWGIQYSYESGREASEFIGSKETAIYFAAKSRPRPRLRLVETRTEVASNAERQAVNVDPATRSAPAK
jgi:hypothetical protein